MSVEARRRQHQQSGQQWRARGAEALSGSAGAAHRMLRADESPPCPWTQLAGGGWSTSPLEALQAEVLQWREVWQAQPEAQQDHWSGAVHEWGKLEVLPSLTGQMLREASGGFKLATTAV